MTKYNSLSEYAYHIAEQLKAIELDQHELIKQGYNTEYCLQCAYDDIDDLYNDVKADLFVFEWGRQDG